MRSVFKFVCYVSLRSNKFLIISFTIQIWRICSEKKVENEMLNETLVRELVSTRTMDDNDEIEGKRISRIDQRWFSATRMIL